MYHLTFIIYNVSFIIIYNLSFLMYHLSRRTPWVPLALLEKTAMHGTL